MNVKVRGLFSTALVKILLEKGYNIVQPSEKQKERFHISSEETPDITIKDLIDKSGFSILGKEAHKIVKDLKDILWDSIFVKVSEKKFYDGEYVRIMEGTGIMFSESISKEKQVEMLVNLVNILPKSVKVCIKKEGSIDKIKEEVLSAKPETIEKWYAFLGYESKKILDEWRKKVLYTIPNHHIYRTSKTLTKLVDFVEILKPKESEVLRAFKEYIVNSIREKGTIIRRHKKVSGKDFTKLEVVKEVKLENNKIKVITIRFLKPGIVYDGLNEPIEEGDYAITTYEEGSWFFEIQYFNRKGELKGKFININTPLEIVGTNIRYIDLEVDVVEKNRRRYVIDENIFKQLINNPNVEISNKLVQKVEEVKKQLLDSL